MQTAKDLFIHELTDMLDAEQQLLDALEEQSQDSGRPELQKAFASHRAQTEKQVERIQQIFEEIGEEPEETECYGMRGLIQEVKAFKEEDPSEEIMDIFNVGAATKVEHYEIHAYESLIELADQLELTKASRLLNQSLKEEEQTLKKMEGFHKKLKPSETGMEEEEMEMESDEEGGQQSRRSASSSRSGRGQSKGRSRKAA